MLGLWLFAGMFLAFAHGVLARTIGIALLFLFVATYIFLAYGYPDDEN